MHSPINIRYNPSIYWNRQYLKKQLTPNYVNIKAPYTSPAHKHTQRRIPAIRIKDEIRYLHSKKQKLNQQIYYLHIALANTWKNAWPYNYNTIEEKLGKETKTKYRTLDIKLIHVTQTQTKTPHKTHTFYPRLTNNTSIRFSNGETALIQKGLKYNLHSKPKNWIHNLALEAETAISLLPSSEQDVYRKLVVDHIGKLQQQNPSHKPYPETKLIKSVQAKPQENNAMITRAAKGNSIVILPTDYENKIKKFISDNNFHAVTTGPTNTFQTQVRNTVKQSKTLIPKDS